MSPGSRHNIAMLCFVSFFSAALFVLAGLNTEGKLRNKAAEVVTALEIRYMWVSPICYADAKSFLLLPRKTRCLRSTNKPRRRFADFSLARGARNPTRRVIPA